MLVQGQKPLNGSLFSRTRFFRHLSSLSFTFLSISFFFSVSNNFTPCCSFLMVLLLLWCTVLYSPWINFLHLPRVWVSSVPPLLWNQSENAMVPFGNAQDIMLLYKMFCFLSYSYMYFAFSPGYKCIKAVFWHINLARESMWFGFWNQGTILGHYLAEWFGL